MAGIKISNLPAVATALATDTFPVVQAGVTSKETLAQVQTLFGFTTGILGLAQGGTGAALVAANGAIPYSTASAMAFLAPGSAGQLFRSGGAGAPTWTTATFAATYAASTLLYSNGANAVTGLATTNRAALATSAAGVPNWLALTNGQIVIGSTAGAPAAANLTAGPGISISSGSNSITISGTGSASGWTEVTGTTQAIVADNGYVANNAGVVTLTLPVTAAFGTYLAVVGKGAGGWLIAQNAGQNIQIGSSSSTVGAGGSVASTNRFDSVEFVCTTANTTWTVLGGPQGSLTIV